MSFKSPRLRPALTAILLAASLAGCAHGSRTTPKLSEMVGKKVALVEVTGEESARNVVQVALINELVQRGTFILISKQDVEAARANYAQDPTDWEGIARRAGADFALRARVLKFLTTEHQGYSEVEEEDDQLAEEQGPDARMTKRLYKVKSLDGDVEVMMDFADLKTGQIRSGLAQAKDKVVAEAKTSAIHLPPRLSFLEKIAGIAFHKFFDQYN
jgi:hypothetical protein